MSAAEVQQPALPPHTGSPAALQSTSMPAGQPASPDHADQQQQQQHQQVAQWPEKPGQYPPPQQMPSGQLGYAPFQQPHPQQPQPYPSQQQQYGYPQQQMQPMQPRQQQQYGYSQQMQPYPGAYGGPQHIHVQQQPGLGTTVTIDGIGTFQQPPRSGQSGPPMSMDVYAQAPRPQYALPSPTVVVQSPSSQYAPLQSPMSPSVVDVVATAPSPAGGVVLAGAPPPPGCPPGLQCLQQLSQLWLQQVAQLLDDATTLEVDQQYRCLTTGGVQVFLAQETTPGLQLQLFRSHRPFTIQIVGPTGQPALTLTRPLRLNSGCCCYVLPINFWFMQDMEVMDAAGAVLGHVTQRWTMGKARLDILNGDQQLLGYIQAPSYTWSCLGDIEFKVLRDVAGGKPEQLASVTKKWSGVMREEFLNNADVFSIVFHTDLSITCKALIFASAFLIDFMYFEDRNKKTSSSSSGGGIGGMMGGVNSGSSSGSNFSSAEAMAVAKRVENMF